MTEAELKAQLKEKVLLANAEKDAQLVALDQEYKDIPATLETVSAYSRKHHDIQIAYIREIQDIETWHKKSHYEMSINQLEEVRRDR